MIFQTKALFRQVLQAVDFIIIRCLEVSRHNAGKLCIITFRHIGLQYQAAHLTHRHQRLSHRYIIAFLHQAVFYEPPIGPSRLLPYPTCWAAKLRMPDGHSGMPHAKLQILFATQSGYLPIFLHVRILPWLFHKPPLPFSRGHLPECARQIHSAVHYPGPLQYLLQFYGRKIPLPKKLLLPLLPGLVPTESVRQLYHFSKSSRVNHFSFHPSRFCFLRRQYDFI